MPCGSAKGVGSIERWFDFSSLLRAWKEMSKMKSAGFVCAGDGIPKDSK